jgi:hypothetical protein
MSPPDSPPAAGPPQPAPDHQIDLRDPWLAAFLAWLVPGAGHWYQGRRHKAILFFVCILGTFFYGLYLGEGRVVYASMRPEDRRWPYFCQVGAGLPALPAVVQTVRVRRGQAPLWGGLMAPPQVGPRHQTDDLDRLHYDLHRYFELGTVYTMIAGLLNILAVFDAWGGPAWSEEIEAKRRRREEGGVEPAAAESPP